jgi:transcriptional regulator with XRE-family HTH domain
VKSSNMTEALPPKLGARLKHARMVLGFHLKEVASQAQVTEGYLSKIENDRAQPSFAILHRLAQALKVNMSQLFAEADCTSSKVSVIRHEERPTLRFGHRRAGNSVALEKLAPSGPGYLLQANIHVIDPDGGSSEVISHAGQEFGYVIEGCLDLFVDNETVRLHIGDSFYFSSELGHRYRNPGDSQARVLWVNTPPTF